MFSSSCGVAISGASGMSHQGAVLLWARWGGPSGIEA